MHELPADWTALCAVVLLLGLKHGFDADHLAAIDGLTRHNSRLLRRFACYCGALFSLGHGAIVLAIAVLVGVASASWEAPAWLELSGAWISIGFLTLIGIVNLRAVLTTAAHEVVAPVGLKGRLLGRLYRAGHPVGVAAVGALFALSFDTISQSALFALTATRLGGIGHALGVGLLFVLGMLITDGVNGLWISRLIARADRVACIASRVMSLAVSGVTLLVAGLGAARLASTWVERWSEGKELLFGGAVVVVVTISFLTAVTLARSRPTVS